MAWQENTHDSVCFQNGSDSVKGILYLGGT